MKPGLILTIPNFLTDSEAELNKSKEAEYKSYKFTGVVYPNIAISSLNATEVKKLEDAIGERLAPILPPFYRLYTPEDNQPTYIHTDGFFKGYTLIIFLNKKEDCYGGTSFWKHKAWKICNYTDDLASDVLDELAADSYIQNAWNLEKTVPMENNTALLFDSSWYHSRYPQEIEQNRYLKICFLQELKDEHESTPSR